MKIRLDNMVASVHFHREIDIEKVKNNFENAIYDREKFPALIIRFFDTGTTVLLFSSGKAVITGTKNIDQIKETVSHLINNLPAEKDTPAPTIDIVNTVYTIETGTPINLDEIAFTIPNCEYDPEQFTGLVYRPKGIKSVLLIFASGNMVCSGSKNIQDVREALKKFYHDVEKYALNIEIPPEIKGGEEQ